MSFHPVGRTRFSKLALFVLAIAMVFAVSTASIASATSTGDTANSRGVTSLLRSANRLNVTLTGFSPTLGATRTEVEELFHYIDKRTIFKVASKIKGVPRTLGQDKGLYTAVEINGYPEVVDVQVVSILDTSSKTILEGQVAFDSLTCREFSSKAAQKWCTGRILNTNANGLVTATNSKTFDGLAYHRSNVPLFGEFERSGRPRSTSAPFREGTLFQLSMHDFGLTENVTRVPMTRHISPRSIGLDRSCLLTRHSYLPKVTLDTSITKFDK